MMDKAYKQILESLLVNMDVPPERKRITPINIGWLRSNLRTTNRGHKDYGLVMYILENYI